MSTRFHRADVARWAAEETALASPDVFGDWFGAELNGAQAQIDLPGQIQVEVTAEDFVDTPTAQLYMLMVDSGQSDKTRIAAINAISNRYLAAKADYIERLIAEQSEAA